VLSIPLVLCRTKLWLWYKVQAGFKITRAFVEECYVELGT